MTPAGRLLIWRAAVVRTPACRARRHARRERPGGDLAIATGDGLLLPRGVQPENRKAMPWEDFLRGARLGAGARVTELAA